MRQGRVASRLYSLPIQRMLCRDQEAAALAAAETEPGLLVQRAEQLMRRGDLATALAVLDTAVTVLTDKHGNIWVLLTWQF